LHLSIFALITLIIQNFFWIKIYEWESKSRKILKDFSVSSIAKKAYFTQVNWLAKAFSMKKFTILPYFFKKIFL